MYRQKVDSLIYSFVADSVGDVSYSSWRSWLWHLMPSAK